MNPRHQIRARYEETQTVQIIMIPYYNFPFLFHTIVEFPACLNFFLLPDDQLPQPAPQAHAIIRQYAVLLLSSVMISTIFTFRVLDTTSGKVAGALALYHIAPLFRAGSRIITRTRFEMGQSVLKEPFLHFVIHSLCLGSLGLTCWNLHMYSYSPWA
jgi:hypothetical protein